MENELIKLLEKFFRKQISEEEVIRLKKLFSQTDTESILSVYYKGKWEKAGFDPENEVEEHIWKKLQEHIQSKPAPVKLPLWRKYLRIAASILIPLFCIGLGYYLSGNKIKQVEENTIVQVEVGQKANVQLPDGTHVWLNSAGLLTYDNTYNQKERVVYLQGEAYFEVNRDITRPFIVKANNISVETLGTTFDVKAYPDDDCVTAILIDGSIRVSSPSHSEVLKPNEKLTVTKNNGQFSISHLQAADKNVSWINNQLAFEQERLEDIAKTLERMYSIQIRFASENLKDIRFSGTIKNHNMENVLQLITFVSPIRYSLENDTTFVIQSR